MCSMQSSLDLTTPYRDIFPQTSQCEEEEENTRKFERERSKVQFHFKFNR